MGQILRKSASKRIKPRYFKNSKAVKKRVKEQFIKESYLYTLFVKTKGLLLDKKRTSDMYRKKNYVKS